MGKDKSNRVGLLVCFVSMVVLMAGSVMAQTEATVADKLAEAINYYGELEFDQGLDVATGLLKGGSASSTDSIAIYAVMSMLNYGKGEEFLGKSYKFLEKMAAIGPCTINLPHEFWPQQLRHQWYNVARDKGALACPGDKDGDIQTVAIMEFDNYSVGKYQEELGFLTKGIADFFEADFAKFSDLKVVERDKVDFILNEIAITESGKVSSSTAIQVGKLLGAQIMVFGNVTQIDGKKCKMMVKAVKVETSEIIATVEKEGKPDYFKMEKELVKELAAKLDMTLSDETSAMLDAGGTESFDAATLYSKGLHYMDKYDYKKAYDFFKLAYEKDNSFVEAKKKMDIYRPLATS
ncbi:MAG: hypothetical protein GY865_17670 [candidate division Zixibacteria bacterium]|nr:hypothetical protein [candidate division Zixibacteria bacterium]